MYSPILSVVLSLSVNTALAQKSNKTCHYQKTVQHSEVRSNTGEIVHQFTYDMAANVSYNSCGASAYIDLLHTDSADTEMEEMANIDAVLTLDAQSYEEELEDSYHGDILKVAVAEGKVAGLTSMDGIEKLIITELDNSDYVMDGLADEEFQAAIIEIVKTNGDTVSYYFQEYYVGANFIQCEEAPLTDETMGTLQPVETLPVCEEQQPYSDLDDDAIQDQVDACPDQPETYNGFEDRDGCPDELED
jgi:hypothetical protein